MASTTTSSDAAAGSRAREGASAPSPHLPMWQPRPDAPTWRSARGECVIADDGRQFIDLQMEHGACLWGHGTVAERIEDRFSPEQLAEGVGSQQTTELRERATRRLVRWAAGHWDGVGEDDVVAGILHSGAEAVETVVKTALAATGRRRVVVFEDAYHGSFGLPALLSASPALRRGFGSLLADDAIRRVLYGEVPELDERDACVLVEPIQGASGAMVPPVGFLQRLRERCDEAGTLLVLDDVLAGSGRTGVELEGAECAPDAIALAKAIGGGSIASAALVRRDIAERAWSREDSPSLSTTYYGHPYSCAGVLATLDLLEGADLPVLVEPIDEAMRRLAELTGWTVTGRGAFRALHCPGPDSTDAGSRLASALLAEGVIAGASGTRSQALQLLPPLTIQQSSLDHVVDSIATCVRRLDER